VLGIKVTLQGKKLSELGVVLGKDVQPQEKQYKHKGALRYVRWYVTEAPETGYVAIAEDITRPRLQMEEMLRAERYKTLETLIGGIAHDINNMMVGLTGSINLLKKRSSEDHKNQKLIDTIEQAGRRITSMVQSLMAFTKAGVPVMEPVDMKALITDVVDFCFKGSPHRVSIEIEPDILNAKGDQTKLSQVLINLLLNARDAMESPGVVTVRAENYTAEPSDHALNLNPGMYVHISVSDTGGGIPEENIDRIFDPFFTTKEKGTGLGLAITKQIITAHGGAITVDSRPGIGTTFHLYIPATKESPKQETEEVSSETELSGSAIVYDDEDTVREVLSEFLKMMGVEVITTGSSKECLEEVRSRASEGRPFDFAFLDLTVQGDMGGHELVGTLKVLSPKTKFVLISGYPTEEPSSYGFDGFCQKPFRFETMQRLLQELSTKDVPKY
ncbi:MAG: response regulator, partial [Nitrospirae bacterium]